MGVETVVIHDRSDKIISMTELGKIQRPAVEDFTEKRKIYCVPNIYPFKDSPDELKKLIDKFWQEVSAQLDRLEAAGKIKKIFCENVYAGDEKGLKILSKVNEKALAVVKRKIEEGATLLPLEDREIFAAFLDWRNCLAVIQTEAVYEKVFPFFKEIYQKRLQHIQDMIDKNTAPGEASLLIMVDEERVKLQFPSDIEVFLVTPPSYDDLMRWFRDNMRNEAAT